MAPKICEEGGGGLFLPLFGDWEQRWPNGLRIILYLIGLLWFFMGVALLADVFMGAIERITSKTKRVFNHKTQRHVTTMVWNATVANLTLMALGSSAPEILLSVIELLSNNMFNGELGPSTIVGSAAFNLLCITAVCVVSIPPGEIRMIKELGVYCITASFSVFAYLWLLIILLGFSENVIEVWEGIVTFMFFPVLVLLAFAADKGWILRSLGGTIEEAPRVTVTADMSEEELAAVEMQIRQQHGDHLTDLQVMKLIEQGHQAPKSRAERKIAAIRELTGGRRVAAGKSLDPLHNVVPTIDACVDKMSMKNCPPCWVEFAYEQHTALENCQMINIGVKRTGDLGTIATVCYATRDGTAKAESDYKPMKGHLSFMPGQTTNQIEVYIVNDTGVEEDEDFYVDLTTCDGTAAVGERKTVTVTIIDDDEPGILSFSQESLSILEGSEDLPLELVVKRKDGGSGIVGCQYRMEDDTAIAGSDYIPAKGVLTFASGQMEASVCVTVKARGRYDSQGSFRVILEEPFGGSRFDETTHGGANCCIMSVTIQSDQSTKERVDRLKNSLQESREKDKVWHSSWGDQFRHALCPQGGEEGSSSSLADKVLHVVNFPWKLLCATVPPTDFLDGWLCFVSALAVIGLVTAFIGDMASLLGCTMDVPDSITAITFVALGTSLPDTFASKAAAAQDPYADASIGNVTGSNSVNVFLGLGLPWMIASIYWTAGSPNAEWVRKYGDKSWAKDWQDGAFIVEAGGLGVSVGTFSGTAVICILLLFIRRKVLGGELGGQNQMSRYLTAGFLVSLWVLYIAISSWYLVETQ